MPQKSNRAPAVGAAGKPLTSTDAHSLAHVPNDATPIAMLTVADLRAVIRAEMGAPTPTDTTTPLPITEIVRLRPGTSRGWVIGHVTPVGMAARRVRLYLLRDVDAALAVAPPETRARGVRTCRGDEGDEIDALIASGSVTR